MGDELLWGMAAGGLIGYKIIDDIFKVDNEKLILIGDADNIDGNLILKVESRKSDKEKSNDIPSWAEGTKPAAGESGKDYAKRLCDKKYGEGKYNTGPGSEYKS